MEDKITIIIISSLVGALVSYLGAVLKNALDTSSRISEHLLEKRTEQYTLLWDITRAIPRWPRDPSITYKNLEKLSQRLRDWYFDGGGIYLSRRSQDAYGKLQETVDCIYKGKTDKEKSAAINSDEADETNEYDQIRKKCSTLRTLMTDDLLSRRSAPKLDLLKGLVTKVRSHFH